ncbi:glycosyltransferase [Candidatus Uabimicrobium sp. HlEnr_7]|uniref:glycosyltransferase n=1 Tax=Candidatus Uabimicrobium helgolandensis TaxID=3095367 RepID=UPI00355802A0
MKVVQVITELRPAGAEQIVLELSRGLQSLNHEVTVVSLLKVPENSIVVEKLQALGIRILSLNLTKLSIWRIWKLRRFLSEIEPQIVHAHLIHANVVSRLNSWRRKYILVNTIHIAEKRKGKNWHFILDRLTFRLCDCMTVVSKAVQEFHSQKIGVTSKALPVIYNGITDITCLSPEKISDLKCIWGIEHCTKIIGSVGRLNRQKGYDVFFNLLTELSAHIPKGEHWAVVILGEGEERSKLESYCTIDNIKVRLPGFRKDAADCIAAFDLFVMPSRYEGFGLVLAEAMSHGVPVVASNVDSLPELLEYYTNGCVADFTRKDTVEKIIKQLSVSKNTPCKEFTLSKMISSYIDLYNKYDNNYKYPR